MADLVEWRHFNSSSPFAKVNRVGGECFLVFDWLCFGSPQMFPDSRRLLDFCRL
jgi:hypothetical protein